MTAGLVYELRIAPEFAAWRTAARQLLLDGVAPEAVAILDEEDAAPAGLFGAPEYPRGSRTAVGKPAVPEAFLESAQRVACHRDRDRWNLLYRVLVRLQATRGLLHDELDADVAHMRRMEQQVGRDLHKMHAFLRFRVVEEDGQEHSIAWYRPDHRILPLAAPFFVERFATMRWTIMTADATASWDPELKQLAWAPGVPREAAPAEDEMEAMWRAYYGSIFNPARTNTRAMRAEMPVRYWRELPELQVMPQLLQNAEARVETMLAAQKKQAVNHFVPHEHSLPVLAAALPACKGCALYACATQAVFGAGKVHSPLMLVGEQPGDEEDHAGKPFVGPAGRLLNQLLDELGLDRERMYVTNAVKHFKFVERGRRRIHESPRLSEVMACRPWLLAELDAVKPKVVLALGATAAKSLLGAKFALMKQRGQVVESPYARQVIATLHPSALLRADDARKAEMVAMFKQDVAYAARLADA